MMDDVEKLLKRIRREAGSYRELSRAIWRRPELGMQEFFAAQQLTARLRQANFEVEMPFAGQPTGFRAIAGQGGAMFALVAEYDALKSIGHGCGHNLIAVAAVAAAEAVAAELAARKLPGRIAVLGTPGEESKGGKVLMLKHHCLDGVDALMMVHPSWRTTPDMGSLGIRRFEIVFRGKAAHAATAPELGKNALDAVLLVFNAVNAWRQQLPESARIHGVISHGGVVPNIIPERAGAVFFLRSPEEKLLDGMEKRFRNIVRGAALMTDTRSRIAASEPFYQGRVANPALNAAYAEAAATAGLKVEYPAVPGRGSSDFGNFSRILPGTHPYFAISEGRIPGHSPEFAEAARSELGEENMLRAAAAMGATALRYLSCETFRSQVNAGSK